MKNTEIPTQTTRKAFKNSAYQEKVSRTLLKSISWRVIASLITFITTFLIVKISGYEFSTSAFSISLHVTLIESTAKMIIYFFHERTWLRISYGKILPRG